MSDKFKNLKVGDTIQNEYDDNPVVIKSIKWNDENDMKSFRGNRVTINGEFWSIENIIFPKTSEK